jgi:hypothetical protein
MPRSSRKRSNSLPGYSDRTKTVIPRMLIPDIEDFFPDRSATPNADGSFPKRVTGTSTWRLPEGDVPRTTIDMWYLFQWRHGDTLYGNQHKEHTMFKGHVQDIEKQWGKEDEYLDIYIETESYVPIEEQLKKFGLNKPKKPRVKNLEAKFKMEANKWMFVNSAKTRRRT